MKPTIKYQTFASPKVKQLKLTEEQFWDEPANHAGRIPKFDHAYQYLHELAGIDESELEWTEITAPGQAFVFTAFYPRCKSIVIRHPDGCCELMIVSTISESQSHLLRMQREVGAPEYRMVFNSVFERHVDGSEVETRLDR